MTLGPFCLVDPRSWDELLLDSEASLRLVDTALEGLFWRWDSVDEKHFSPPDGEQSYGFSIGSVARDPGFGRHAIVGRVADGAGAVGSLVTGVAE